MTVDLLIAGRRIRLQSGEGVTLAPDQRFSAFTMMSGGDPDIFVDVETGPGEIPSEAVRVFDAQLMEETSEGARNTGEPFWEVMRNGEETFVRVYLKNPERSPVLVLSRSINKWKIFTATEGGSVDPLPYPLDGLLLYFLCSLSGDMMIHGSGVVCSGRGWLFTGRSGSGKTTLAKIFDRAGDRVIHDDRLVLRRDGAGWVMHSTPVYRNDEPRTATLDHLWVIRHGAANVSEPVAGAEAVAMIMANCIQQNWDGEAASRLAAAVENLVSSVRVSRLSFLPDGSIRDYLLLRSTEERKLAAGALSEMLTEGHTITITAGGYSMWPAIKPGDRVRISPPEKDIIPARGMVVALRRDGGFVVHRVTDVRRGTPADHVGRDESADQTGRGGRADQDGKERPADHVRRGEFADHVGKESPADHIGNDVYADRIRTRGDTSRAADPWISAGDIAGLVTLVTAGGDTIPVPRRRFPYLAGSLAVTVAQLWSRIAGRK